MSADIEVTGCMCEWDDAALGCDGSGFVYCSGCDGDGSCVCICGGSSSCGGCEACERPVDADADFIDEDES